MDDPVAEIPTIISLLCTTPPSVQSETISRYFLPDATFTHPFCRVPSSARSRWTLSRIYRWYKIMSPRVSVEVHSVAWDRGSNVLYAGITQVFAIWFVPFHRSEVSLVAVLHLEQREGVVSSPDAGSEGSSGEERSLVDLGRGEDRGQGPKWYIASQNDLYQTDQFLRFVVPQLAWVMVLWQLVATAVCVVCSYVFAPVTWWEDTRQREFQRKEKQPGWNDAK